MANEYGEVYKIVQGLDTTNNPSRVADGRLGMRSRSMQDTVNIANPSNNALTTSVIRLGYLPFGSKVFGGKILVGPNALTAAIVDVGVVGLSGVGTDADALGNNINLQATPVADLPNDLASVATIPYEVTDPKGAAVSVTVLVNSTATANTTLKVVIDTATP